MNHGLDPDTVAAIQGVLAGFSTIESAVLYGSRAKGNFKPGSDIDLTLHGTELTSTTLGGVADALDDLLLPHTIDLSIFGTLDHAELREHIERVGMVIYQCAHDAARPNVQKPEACC